MKLFERRKIAPGDLIWDKALISYSTTSHPEGFIKWLVLNIPYWRIPALMLTFSAMHCLCSGSFSFNWERKIKS